MCLVGQAINIEAHQEIITFVILGFWSSAFKERDRWFQEFLGKASRISREGFSISHVRSTVMEKEGFEHTGSNRRNLHIITLRQR